MTNSRQIALLLQTPAPDLRARTAELLQKVEDVHAIFCRRSRMSESGWDAQFTYDIYSTPVPAEVFHALRRFHGEHADWQSQLTKVQWWERLWGAQPLWRLHFVRTNGKRH